MRNPVPLLALALVLLAGPAAAGAGGGYDPLELPAGFAARTVELEIEDAERGRTIPLLAWLPAQAGPRPALLFSHGLGGSRAGGAYLGRHWSARGYVVLFLQHPGSDESVWKGRRPLRALLAMKGAASPENFLLRVVDVPVAVTALHAWNRTAGHPLAGRIDLARIGMAGHSFGAVTAQAVSGQRARDGGSPFTDPRIKAAVIMSPGAARDGTSPEASFGAVAIPWMLLTGTHDDGRIVGVVPEDRLKVYPALPPGAAGPDKYELVLSGAEHSAFADRALRGDRLPRDPAHHRAILALTTAFWDAHLTGDPAARAWLDGDGPRSVLRAEDRFRRK